MKIAHKHVPEQVACCKLTKGLPHCQRASQEHANNTVPFDKYLHHETQAKLLHIGKMQTALEF